MRRITAFFIASILLTTCFTFAVNAAGSSMDTATPISFGSSYSGVMVEDGADYYKITLPSSGEITIDFSTEMWQLEVCLYDASGNQIDKVYPNAGSNSDTLKWTESYNLLSGTYYFKFREYGGYTGNYSFTVTFVSSGESFSESQEKTDNSFERSNAISLGTTYKGQLGENDEVDYYKFTLSLSGEIIIAFTTEMWQLEVCLYDASGNLIDKVYPNAGSDSDTMRWNKSYDLLSGTYYFRFRKYGGYLGNYSLNVGFNNSGESFSESQEKTDNSFERSNSINLKTTYKGQLAENDEVDYYKFTLSSAGKINVNLNSEMWKLEVCLYDASGNQIDKVYPNAGSNSDTLQWTKSYDLSAGTYYFKFKKDGYLGNYSFSVSNGSTPPSAEHNTTPPADRPTQAPDNNAPEDVTAPPAELVEPGDDSYIIPDPDADVDITINIYLDFEYTVINNYVVIVNYIGGDTYVTIPEYIENYTVVGVGKRAFKDKGVQKIKVPSTVTQFGAEAFDDSVELECVSGSAAETYAINNGFNHTSESADSDGGKNPIGTIILVAAVVVIVAVAGAVAVIVIGKKKSVA
ncbi:MAG: pre-peptidase C-terminal domain-containing protein [Clostridia bacterium]|nr:pre-peptidase C-terminal domain-containing protein [Clostridia bacterium]